MRYLLIFLSILFFLNIHAQCDPPAAMIDLDVNNVNARLLTGGDLWWDRSDGRYMTPKENPGNVTAIFAGGLWLAGTDPGDNLKVSVQSYGAANGGNGYWPGPLDPGTGQTTQDNCSNFDRFFTAKKSEIENHISDFNDNGIIDGPIPISILSWPGIGNPEFFSSTGFQLPNQDLAPFVDRDNDGKYEPTEGDFPRIKGEEAVWWVINDIGEGNISGNPNFQPVQMEIQVMAFACSDASGSALDNTTFYEFTYINRASEDLMNFVASLWVDPDLGCYTDDFIGSSPEHKMAIVYNEDALDGSTGTSCFAGIPTYGEDIPILGIKVLESTPNHLGEDVGFSSFMYYMNPSLGNPPPGMTDPSTATEVFNYLNGLWRDGTPLTEGGSGYNPGSTDTVKHAFFGDPAEFGEWSMCSAAQPTLDRRMLINSGPYNLAPGEKITITYAVITQLEAEYPCPGFETITQMGEEISNQCDALTNDFNVPLNQSDISVFPNPMKDFTEIASNKLNNPITEIVLTNASGKTVQTYSDLHTNQFLLEKKNLPSGIYFLKVVTKGNSSKTEKLIIY